MTESAHDKVGKPVESPDLKTYLDESLGLERDFLAEIIKSRQTAWRIAAAAGVVCTLAIGAVVGLTPLKDVAPPVVFRVDNVTGQIDEITHLTHSISPGEASDVAHLNRYVLACESYDWHTLQRDYDTCGLLSSPAVQKAYRTKFDGPTALDKSLHDAARIRVDIASITPSDAGTAVVRFSRQRENADGSVLPKENRIATIAYQYVGAPMTAGDRRENPLGFVVTSYRDDPEFSGRSTY